MARITKEFREIATRGTGKMRNASGKWGLTPLATMTVLRPIIPVATGGQTPLPTRIPHFSLCFLWLFPLDQVKKLPAEAVPTEILDNHPPGFLSRADTQFQRSRQSRQGRPEL